LTLPDLSHVPTVDEVSQVSSVQLFMERAVSAVPHFELTQANCAAVAAICRRLDGLPLALELAAPRVRSLSPTELLARLDQALRLLVGGSRDLPQRQQTMSAAIEWSYQLLSTPQQSLFRRLSIFEGGWTLDAAESVTAWGEIVLDEVIDILSDLVEQSLVAVEPSEEGSSRYRMLEPIRQFSHRMALETGEQDTLARYHLNWCLQLAERSASEMRGPNQHQWLDLLDTEHDNLRAALSWSQQREDAGAEELRLATALWRFWEIRGYLTEGRRWLEHALSVTDDVPADLRARGLNAAGNLARDQGDLVQAEKMHEASLRMRREQGDEYGIAVSLTNLANLMLDQGRYAPAEAHYTEALQHFQDQGQRWDIANVQNNLGIVLGYRGEYERATSLLEQALALREELAETASRARTLDALGVVMQRQGELTRARRLHEESLALRLELGEKRGIAIALNNLGIVARSEGNFTEATQLIEESLQLRNTVGDMFGVATSLGALADVARDMGDHDRALRLYRDAISTQRQLGINDGLPDLILGVAALSLAPADPVRSARLLGASEALRETMNQPIPPVNRDGHARIVAGIQRALTPDEYASATERGRRMSLDEAIDEALTSPEVVS
jgi:tetratricopeptide (TPR) repeat protein